MEVAERNSWTTEECSASCTALCALSQETRNEPKEEHVEAGF